MAITKINSLGITNPVSFSAGTAALPSITFSGDTNTGVFAPAADTIAFTEGGTESMRINSSGDVGIGVTVPDRKLHIKSSSATVMAIESTNASISQIYFQSDGATSYPTIGATNDTDFNIQTNNLERMRITSGGSVGIGTTSPSYNFTVENDKNIARFIATNSTAGDVVVVLVANVHTNNATASDYYFVGGINGGSDKIYILGNGDLKNTNNSYGALSDIKIKQDIIDASSQWNDIKNVRVRKFRYKNDPTGFLHIGVVAQELEQVSPNLIDEHKDSEKVEVPVLDDNGNPVLNEDGTPQVKEERIELDTTTKSVKYSILYMKAIKALQEAMERIEQLETKNTSLEATSTSQQTKIDALETRLTALES